MKKIFSILALALAAMTASASEAPSYKLTKAEGAEAHGTIAFTVGQTENASTAKEGETVTMTVTPAEGWAAGTATGKWYAAEAKTQRRADIDLLTDFEPTKLLGSDNTWSFVMKRANAEVNMTYKKLMSNVDITVDDIAPMGYTGQPLEPTVTVKDGETTLVKDQDYTVTYSDNELVGTATVTITGMGDNYAGETTKTFEIYGYAITIDPEIQHGKVTVQPYSVADAEVTVTVEPEQGYALKKLSPMVGKTVLHVDENLTFTMPAMAVFVTAEFELVPTNIVVDVESGDINTAVMAETDNMHKDVTGVTINLKKDVTYTVSAPIAVPGDIIVNGNGATINVEGVSTALFQLAKPVNSDEQGIGRRAPETPAEGYEYVENVIIKDATFKGVKGSIFYDNKFKTCVENFTIENVVMDLATEAVDYQSLIAFEAGCVKDFTIKNSTFSGKNAVAKYFVRCSNGADFAKAGYTEGSVTYENNTFYGLLLTDGQWANNMRYNNNASKIVLSFNKNIFVDCADGNILRRLNNKAFKDFKEGSTMADNTYLVNGAAVDQGTYGNQSDLLFTPYFKDAANGDFSVAKATDQYEKETGDPRWIASAWDAGLYYITLQVGENGQIIAPNTAMADDLVKLTIVPAEGYQLKSLDVFFGKAPIEVAEDYSFYMPSGGVTVQAVFEKVTPTGIKNLTNAAKAQGAWYDLNGRKLQVAPTQKGIYITNGKKVVIK